MSHYSAPDAPSTSKMPIPELFPAPPTMPPPMKLDTPPKLDTPTTSDVVPHKTLSNMPSISNFIEDEEDKHSMKLDLAFTELDDVYSEEKLPTKISMRDCLDESSLDEPFLKINSIADLIRMRQSESQDKGIILI